MQAVIHTSFSHQRVSGNVGATIWLCSISGVHFLCSHAIALCRSKDKKNGRHPAGSHEIHSASCSPNFNYYYQGPNCHGVWQIKVQITPSATSSNIILSRDWYSFNMWWVTAGRVLCDH
jgi:hypothetical protein